MMQFALLPRYQPYLDVFRFSRRLFARQKQVGTTLNQRVLAYHVSAYLISGPKLCRNQGWYKSITRKPLDIINQ
jgi:hypothetical protein